MLVAASSGPTRGSRSKVEYAVAGILLRPPFAGLIAAEARRALVTVIELLECAGVLSSTMANSTYSDVKNRYFSAVPGRVTAWLAAHSCLQVPVSTGYALAAAASESTVRKQLPSHFSVPRALSVSFPLLRGGSTDAVASSHMNVVTGLLQAILHSPIASAHFMNHAKSTCSRICCFACLLSGACSKLSSPQRSTQFEVHVPFGYNRQLESVFGDCASAAEVLRRLCSKLCHESGLRIGVVTKIDEVSELWLILQL